MNSTIKFRFLLAFFFAASISSAQDSIVKKDAEKSFGVFNLSAIYAVPIGNSFVKDGFEIKPGFAFDFHFNINKTPILLGFHFRSFDADIKNTDVVGNYTDSDITYIGIKLGYQYILNDDFRVSAFLGVGSRKYHNSEPVNSDFSFRDGGTSVPFTIEFDYQFSKYFGAFASTGYQIDFLDINAPPEIRGDFDTVDYINFQLGMRIAF
jgi:hypothetical protein